MTEKRSSDAQSEDDEGDFVTQLKNLSNYAHTEINNLYSLIDGLDKKFLYIEVQENYQSQYSINERLDKLERREMQLPLSYDDVIDIKNQLAELKKLVKKSSSQTPQNTEQFNEVSSKVEDTMNDESTTNDYNDLKSEIKKIKKHINSYSAPLKNDDSEKTDQDKNSKKLKKSLIPLPPSKSKRNINQNKQLIDPIANDIIYQVAKEQKEINELDSETKKALNNSYDAKCQASEANYAAKQAQNEASQVETKVDELSSHDKKVDSKIKHIKSKVRKLSKKVDEIDSPSQSENKSESKNEKSDEKENSKSEKSSKKDKSESEKSEKKEKHKLGKIKPLKLTKSKKKDESSKKKNSKDNKSETSKN